MGYSQMFLNTTDEIIGREKECSEMGGGVIVGRLGEEESTLLDQYERLSFEIQLNQAILRRSLSEPSASTATALGRRPHPAASLAPVPTTTTTTGSGACRSHNKSRFHKLLKIFIKPILGSNKNDVAGIKPKHRKNNKKLWKAFSRSLRL